MKEGKKVSLNQKVAVDYFVEQLFKNKVINYETYKKMLKKLEVEHGR